MSDNNWDLLLETYLHGLSALSNYFPSSRELTGKIFEAGRGQGIETTANEIFKEQERRIGPLLENLPLPPATGEERGETEHNTTFIHPLSGAVRRLNLDGFTADTIEASIKRIVKQEESSNTRYHLLWRFLSEQLAKETHDAQFLPGDDRIPDRSIWNELDIRTALIAATSGELGPCFLTVSLGPVQSFIATARTLRDLWTGSTILSWLSFQAMRPILEEFGPQAILTPQIRGNKLFDLWLRKRIPASKPLFADSDSTAQNVFALPHRFIALVPYDKILEKRDGADLPSKIKESVNGGWELIATEVRKKIDGKIIVSHPNWAEHWGEQVTDFFTTRVSALPWNEASEAELLKIFKHESFRELQPEAHKLRTLASGLRDSRLPGQHGRFQVLLDAAMRIAESQKTIRRVPAYEVKQPVPMKCTMLGTYEQMGPPKLSESRSFWDDFKEKVKIGPSRLRPHESHSAIALTKRFAMPAYLKRALGVAQNVTFPDTATVAARIWLAENGLLDLVASEKWNGEWLHWYKQDQDKKKGEPCPDKETWSRMQKVKTQKDIPSPPIYYAIIALDGDHMGNWFRGKNNLTIAESYRSEIKARIEAVPDAGKLLDAVRPVYPSMLRALSEALGNYAARTVPKIVDKHRGTLIYAGGDDVLAFLPMTEAITCARELRDAFSGDGKENSNAVDGFYTIAGKPYLAMGNRGTASAGVVFVHWKEDLRIALDAARAAERGAKEAGRNMAKLTVMRRSGEHTSILLPWSFTPTFARWVRAFSRTPNNKGASDRWVYSMLRDLPILSTLGSDIVGKEMVRILHRTDKFTKDSFLKHPDEKKTNNENIEKDFEDYKREIASRLNTGGPSDANLEVEAMASFFKALMAASFVTRGGDQ